MVLTQVTRRCYNLHCISTSLLHQIMLPLHIFASEEVYVCFVSFAIHISPRVFVHFIRAGKMSFATDSRPWRNPSSYARLVWLSRERLDRGVTATLISGYRAHWYRLFKSHGPKVQSLCHDTFFVHSYWGGLNIFQTRGFYRVFCWEMTHSINVLNIALPGLYWLRNLNKIGYARRNIK